MFELGSYTIRQATSDDAPDVWSLIDEVLRSYGIQPDRRTTDKDLADLTNYYAAKHGAFFVLRHGSTIVGTVAWHREDAETCELCRMYLARAYRGKGLGRMLLNHCLAEARKAGFKTVYLKTASVLREAISLYRQAGFEPVARNVACGNCDLMMRRPLNVD